MRIGIIVAMEKEANLLLHLIENKKETGINGYTIHSGDLGNHKVFAMQCGIGKVNAAIGTMTLIEHFSPELIINTGVAGGASTTVKQMTMVIGTKIAYHDVWCLEEYGKVSGFPLYFHSEEKTVDIIKSIENGKDIKYGLICSGDKFISKEAEVDEIRSHFPDVLAVDMESGAIAQVCYMKKTPLLVARIISDTPGAEKDNTNQYEDFWESAPKHTFQLLSEIIKNLK